VGLVLSALPVDQANAVLGLELGDAVQVVFTPNGIGSPISRYVSIDAIEHDVTASAHLVTLDFSATIGGFTLDSSAFGVLDQNVLGF